MLVNFSNEGLKHFVERSACPLRTGVVFTAVSPGSGVWPAP